MQPGEVVDGFLAAVEARDATAAGGWFTDTATYANVPHPPAVGPAGVAAVLAPILSRSERVRWDILQRSESGPRVWLERVDRFWIDGDEYSVACNGIFEVEGELIAAFRDYVDLGVWRARLGDVIA